MGTFITEGASKEDVIEQIKRECGARLLEHCVNGRELWTVLRPETGDPYIHLFLLSGEKNGWGYKPISEMEGPYYYNVPRSWLQRYPTTNETALVWRRRVVKGAFA
jgi:hypothetical protein